MRPSRPHWLTPALALTALLGCSTSGPVRYDLSGRVTFKGQPVPAGVIFFDPDAAKGNDGPQGYAFIKDGWYDTRREGKGTVGGPHTVRVQGFDGKPGAELPMGRPIFPEYAVAAELPRQSGIQDFDVPAVGKR